MYKKLLIYAIFSMQFALAQAQNYKPASFKKNEYCQWLIGNDSKLIGINIIRDTILLTQMEYNDLKSLYLTSLGSINYNDLTLRNSTGMGSTDKFYLVPNNETYYFVSSISNKKYPLILTKCKLDSIFQIGIDNYKSLYCYQEEIYEDKGLYFRKGKVYIITKYGKLHKLYYEDADSIYLSETYMREHCKIKGDAYICKCREYGSVDLSRNTKFLYPYGRFLIDNFGYVHVENENSLDSQIRFSKQNIGIGSISFDGIIPCNRNYLMVAKKKSIMLLDTMGNLKNRIKTEDGFPIIHSDTIYNCLFKSSNIGFNNLWLKKYNIRYGFIGTNKVFLYSKMGIVYEMDLTDLVY